MSLVACLSLPVFFCTCPIFLPPVQHPLPVVLVTFWNLSVFRLSGFWLLPGSFWFFFPFCTFALLDCLPVFVKPATWPFGLSIYIQYTLGSPDFLTWCAYWITIKACRFTLIPESALDSFLNSDRYIMNIILFALLSAYHPPPTSQFPSVMVQCGSGKREKGSRCSQRDKLKMKGLLRRQAGSKTKSRQGLYTETQSRGAIQNQGQREHKAKVETGRSKKFKEQINTKTHTKKR